MKVLMLGTMVPEETKQHCFKMGQRPSAADSVQNYMIHGLEEIDTVDALDVIGSVRIKYWPVSKIFMLRDSEEQGVKGVVRGVGYYNLPLVAFYFREKRIIKAAKIWADTHKNTKDVIVLIYSMHSPFLKAAKEIKKIIPSAKIVLTVADLPLYMDMRGSIRKLIKKVDWKRITYLMRHIDKYLLYTKYMAEYLNLQKNQWMIFEGIIDEQRIVRERNNKSNERYALYAGNLDSRYGIDLLIEAFSKLSDQEKLVIYGAGFDKERIDRLAKPLSNVEYKGQISPNEVFEKMKEATILINPRPASIGLAKYSCPSKTFEYLASGTPVLMNKLPGLPEEYWPYVQFFKAESSSAYAEDIHEMFMKSDEELAEIGLQGTRFLSDNKTSKIVMKKVYDFVKD